LVKLGLERVPNLPGGGAESNEDAASRHGVDLKSLRLQLSPYPAEVVRARSETVAELLGREPGVILRRRGILLILEQLRKRRGLRRRRLESNLKAFDAPAVREAAFVREGVHQRIPAAVENQTVLRAPQSDARERNQKPVCNLP